MQRAALRLYAIVMPAQSADSIAVIFLSHRSGQDEAGYNAAAERMVKLAKAQPGYIGMDSVRDRDGVGITVSYWADDASARAWCDHPEHVEIREAGRQRWYCSYDLHVARIERSYDWSKA